MNFLLTDCGDDGEGGVGEVLEGEPLEEDALQGEEEDLEEGSLEGRVWVSREWGMGMGSDSKVIDCRSEMFLAAGLSASPSYSTILSSRSITELPVSQIMLVAVVVVVAVVLSAVQTISPLNIRNSIRNDRL